MLTTTTPQVTLNTDGSTLDFDFSFKMWTDTVEDEIAVVFNEKLSPAEIAIIESYDTNSNNIIDMSEVLVASDDYVAGTLSNKLYVTISGLWSSGGLVSSLSGRSEATLALNTDYTLSAPNNDFSSGGTVTLVTGSAYAATGNTITIKSALLRNQIKHCLHGLYAETIETVLDRQVRMIQEAELQGTFERTAITAYMKTLLTDKTAKEARDSLLIYPAILYYEGDILTYENEILTWVA